MQDHLLFEMQEEKKIHLGVTGSIAAYKAISLMRAWQKVGIEVSVTLTKAAKKFVTELSFESLGAEPLYKEMFSDAFSHLAPEKDADSFIIAPASADTIAQLASGRADSLLAAQALAYSKPLYFAPAMNPKMWANPATQDNVRLLEERGHICITPESGVVACNDVGQGRLATDEMLFLYGIKSVTEQDLAGKTVLVTLGATQEPFDDIRYWTNSSTGTMGMCLAIAAWLRGAYVHAICTKSVNLFSPLDPLFQRHTVQKAADMLDVAKGLWHKCDYGIFTAAVADFSPEEHGRGKFKKSEAEEGFLLQFYPNKDILKTLALEKRAEQKVLGFAAEYVENLEELRSLALDKMYAKNMDMVVGNALEDGFATLDNRVFVADRYTREENWGKRPKTQIAWDLISWLNEV